VRSLLLLVVALAGCGSAYTQVGYEVTRRGTGTIAPQFTSEDAAAGSVALGFGKRGASMEVVLRGQEVEMAEDGMASEPWVSASAGLELKLVPLRKGPFAVFLHGGPQRGALVDRTTLDVTWGAGYAYGGGFTVGKGGVALVVDARADEIWYGGPANSPTLGRSSLRALAIGLKLGH
jgi:hypothetical protein